MDQGDMPAYLMPGKAGHTVHKLKVVRCFSFSRPLNRVVMVSYLPLYYKSVKCQEKNVNSFVIFNR
jgi:hypothetical protein